jgi:hypothetical protein
MNFKERKSQLIDVSKLILNDNNPRYIKEDKFQKLVKSLRESPRMLEYRPIIVNEEMKVLGGNMRLKAAIEIGFTKVPILIAVGLTEAEQRELIVKDNVGYGEWDYDLLANQYDKEELEEWGLDIPEWANNNVDLDNFFEDNNDVKDSKNKIVLEYSEEDYAEVMEAFNKREGSREQIIYKLLVG